MKSPFHHPSLLLALLLVAPSTAPAATLVSHWSFDNQTANDSVSGQNGVFEGGATTSNTETAGLLGGRSLDLHDSGSTTAQRVTVNNSSTINFGNNLSISYWMKANFDGVEPTYGQPNTYSRTVTMNQGGTTDPGWEFQRANDAGTLSIRVDTDLAGNQTRTASPIVFDGGWHLVTVTLGSGAIGFYVDGIKYNVGTYNPGNTGFGDSVAKLVFGTNSSGANPFDGWLDDISLWSTSVLTEGEAKALYSLGTILGYDASEANSLFTLHNAGTGTMIVNGELWEYRNGLSGTAGSIQTIDSKQVLFLTSTTGVGVVPEPGRATLAVMAAAFLLFRRTRRSIW